ncbi:MAG: DNA-processing protein DprA [Bacteroidaceae bacterium]|nr:DNA-processing protein DprA [Bacteroidaceae bacterium]
MTDKELLYTMALTRLQAFTPANQRTLLDEVGSATAVYENRRDLGHMMQHFSPRAADILADMDAQLPRCEEELRYARDHRIRILAIHDEEGYPRRLRQCADAPVVLYQLGPANLNARHVISVVGTRRCTERGRDLCQRLAADLARLRPDVLVISGLAYGIDIAAHRAALDNHLTTAAVLAHGLDTIYPPLHRNTAIEMLKQGALLTEYMHAAHIDKVNFVQRNRIVAGLADAVVVVESAAKGGSLITAEMAQDYSREVMAFPGRTTDAASAGCNQLIRRNAAHLITCAQDLINDLGWEPLQQPDGQGTLDLRPTPLPLPTREGQGGGSSESAIIIAALQSAGGDCSLSDLIAKTAMPVAKLTPLLLTMEMQGIIKKLAGNKYHLK